MIHKTVSKFSTQSTFPKKRFCLCLRTFYENTYLVACLLRILLVPCLLFCSEHTSKLLPSTIFPITVKHTVCTYKKKSSFFLHLVKDKTIKEMHAQLESLMLWRITKTSLHNEGITQSPLIRTGPIRLGHEFLGKFKARALGSSNLRTTSKNLRTASAQIFKAKNQVLLPFLIHMYISFTCTYISLNFSLFLCFYS